MCTHTRMERGTTWIESSSFIVIFAIDHAHVLAHAIAVKVRRTKGLFGHHPSRRKITKSKAATPGSSVGAVKTVKILGSGWSNDTELMVMNRFKSYLYG